MQHLASGVAGVAGRFGDADNVGGDFARAMRGLLDVARDFVGGRTLFLNSSRDGAGDLVHLADDGGDASNGFNQFPG